MPLSCLTNGVHLTTHNVAYYRYYRKYDLDKVLFGPGGKPQPCSCPEVKAEVVESSVWETICQLVRDPDFLIEQLHKRNDDDSQTKEIMNHEMQICLARLKSIPDEQKRLVEGYRKGLYADFMMREEMERIEKERQKMEKRKSELDRRLVQRQLTESEEVRIRSFVTKINSGLDFLDFTGKQELIRLLIEKILFNGQLVEIHTIITPDDQLHPVHRGGLRGRGYATKSPSHSPPTPVYSV